MKNRIFHEIKEWIQEFKWFEKNRMWIYTKIWRKPQKIYFSKLPDPNNWNDNNDNHQTQP